MFGTVLLCLLSLAASAFSSRLVAMCLTLRFRVIAVWSKGREWHASTSARSLTRQASVMRQVMPMFATR
jgi:hypothetical protein